MRRILQAISLVCVLGSGFPSQGEEFRMSVMGTMASILVAEESPDKDQLEEAIQSAFASLKRYESIFSDYDSGSEVSQLVAKTAGEFHLVSVELFDVLQIAQEVSRASKGAFDVTVGSHTWNWRAAKRTGRLPSAQDIADAKERTGWEKIVLRTESSGRERQENLVSLMSPNMRLDFGGIAKGRCADLVLADLSARGFAQAAVVLGGDIAIGDAPDAKPGWPVKIETLANFQSEEKPTIFLKNCGISTSGDFKQWIEIDGKRFSHIIDPSSGLGLKVRRSATVIAPNAATSDALATGICVIGWQRALISTLQTDFCLHGWLLVEENQDGETKQWQFGEHWQEID